MQFRQSGQRDERRRRVLRDDAAAQNEQNDSRASKQSSGDTDATVRGYTPAAHADQQPALIELIPIRPWKGLLLLFVGGLLVAGVQALHHYQPQWQEFVGAARLNGLDITQRGSLATWLSASMLSLTALLSLLIYSLRRHKVDDYRGRYRIWLWAAAFAILASIDVTAGLHNIVTGLALKAFGTPLLGDGSIWWMLGALIVLTLPATLIVLDIRHSRAALATGLLSLGCFIAAAFFQLGTPLGNEMNAAVASSCSMSAFLFLAATTMYFARYVCLDAHGLIAVPAEKTEKKQAAEPNAKNEVKAKPKTKEVVQETPAKPKKTAPLAKKPEPQPVLKQQETTSKSAEPMGSPAAALGLSQDEYEGLSKAERRRLRKQLRRQNKAA